MQDELEEIPPKVCDSQTYCPLVQMQLPQTGNRTAPLVGFKLCKTICKDTQQLLKTAKDLLQLEMGFLIATHL